MQIKKHSFIFSHGGTLVELKTLIFVIEVGIFKNKLKLDNIESVSHFIPSTLKRIFLDTACT